MSQVKCVSFRILASTLTVIPDASTRCDPLPWSFPVAGEVGQVACPALQLTQASALQKFQISKERWLGICMNFFYQNLILNYCVVCSFRVPSALFSATITFPFCWKIAKAWIWGKVSVWLYVILKCLVLYCMGSMVMVLTETPVSEKHPGDQWESLKVLMCRGRSVTTVPVNQGWLSLWTFC